MLPQEIFVIRFFIAYIFIWTLSTRKLWADSWRDELSLMFCGFSGGSLYFFAENTALGITQTTNVSFLICTTPILTMVLSYFFDRQKVFSKKLTAGSLVSLAGVAMLVSNGHFVLKISPLGDLLTLLAALSWAFYSLVVKRIGKRYSSVFITRKVFFYGLLTILPVFCISPWHFPISGYGDVRIWANLLFLSLIASMLCFLSWNIVVKRLGTIKSSHYLYLNPIFTILFASLILDERLTIYSMVGVVLVLVGVVTASDS